MDLALCPTKFVQQATKDLVVRKFNIKISVTYEKYHFIVFIIGGFFSKRTESGTKSYIIVLYISFCVYHV